MKKFVFIFVSLLLLNTGAAIADHHGYVVKDLIENDRVRVVLVTIKPGAESPSVVREQDRLVYAVKGGAIQRKYDDGSTALYTLKTGDVLFTDKPEDKQKYSIKNMGKSAIILQVTFLK